MHVLTVDPSRVQQVFWNVLRNAAKFTPNDGVVSVLSGNPRPDQLVVEITDTGVGIELENLEKIFDAFEQAGPRREGLGLGLAISKAVIKMRGGNIRAVSAGLGKGATFIIEVAASADGM